MICERTIYMEDDRMHEPDTIRVRRLPVCVPRVPKDARPRTLGECLAACEDDVARADLLAIMEAW